MASQTTLKLTGIASLLIILACACSESEPKDNKGNSTANTVEDVEVIVPEKIREFDQIDTLLYSFIGLNSFATDDGGFILPVWGPQTMVRTNSEASEVLAATKQGRGPGELTDMGIPSMGDDEIYVYDRNQVKIAIYNSRDLSLIKEFVVEPYQGLRVDRVFPSFEDESVLFLLKNRDLVVDEMQNQTLVRFYSERGEYGASIPINGQPQAPLAEVDSEGRTGMSMLVPFSHNSFIIPAPDKETLLIYDTRTGIIAEINADFDTLRTIPVNLPVQDVSTAERDSIKAEVDSFGMADWGVVEPYIPTTKAPADNMLYNNDEIWLKSNFRGNSQKWMVLNMDGQVIKEVHLPKGSRLTHVSDEHLGVRINEVTFALYENPAGF